MVNEKEFLVDSVSVEEVIVLRGACNKGSILRGDVFRKSFKTIYERNSEGGYDAVGYEDVKDVDFRVVEIISYGKLFDELPQSLSGEIHVVGNNPELLQEKGSLVT